MSARTLIRIVLLAAAIAFMAGLLHRVLTTPEPEPPPAPSYDLQLPTL